MFVQNFFLYPRYFCANGGKNRSGFFVIVGTLPGVFNQCDHHEGVHKEHVITHKDRQQVRVPAGGGRDC